MILTRAPMRIPLGGGGTDLPSYYSRYGGFLLSAAITKYVYVVLNKPTVDGLIRLKYSQSETVKSINEIRHRVFREALRFIGIDRGVEIATLADAPAGTGLGSSGSFTVALLAALHAFKRKPNSPQTLAEEAYEIERIRAGIPGGKQDQYLAAFGGLICLNIDKTGKVTVSPLDIDPYTLERLKSNLLLFYTGITRRSSKIQKEQDENTENAVPEVIESLHRTKKIGLDIKKALERGDLDRFGELLHQHWENKKIRSHEISNSKIDYWYKIARDNGALGGKILGAGGGGFFVFYCNDEESKRNIRRALAKEGLREADYDFDFEGAKVLVNF